MTGFRISLLSGAAAAVMALQVGQADAGDVGAANDWSGFYAGGHIGAGMGQMYYDSSPQTVSGSGALGGLQMGYNIDMGDYLFGIEADASIASMPLVEGGTSDGHDANTDLLASVRGRLGMDVGSALIYATGGAGWINGTLVSSNGRDDDRYSEFVPVVGMGVETMLTDNISLRAEGQWYIADALLDTYEFSSDENTLKDVLTARIGMNIHF